MEGIEGRMEEVRGRLGDKEKKSLRFEPEPVTLNSFKEQLNIFANDFCEIKVQKIFILVLGYFFLTVCLCYSSVYLDFI